MGVAFQSKPLGVGETLGTSRASRRCTAAASVPVLDLAGAQK